MDAQPPHLVTQGVFQPNAGFAPPPQYGNNLPAPFNTVTQQPRNPNAESMNIVNGQQNCYPGLAYLATVDQLLVKQQVEPLEVFLGFETCNKFSIKNAFGQRVYYAAEDSNCCTRMCLGAIRPFKMQVFDNFRNEVIQMYRPLACSDCCCPCCLQSIEVCAPPGNKIGSIEQQWSLLKPTFHVKNSHGDTVLHIVGPVCTIRCCGNVDFKIYSVTGQKVGKISKNWSGLLREAFTDSDMFGVTFPIDLDVHIKAVLLGATFLIDAMFFESSGSGVNSTSFF